MLDIFRTDAFSLTSLTEAINKLPFKPGRIGELGIFREKGVRTTTVVVEERDGRLSLVQTSPRGAPAETLGAPNKRKVRSFSIPHIAQESTIMADEVQGVRTFGSEDSLEAVQSVVDERMSDLRANVEVTLEHMRVKAIQGIVKDADGSTLLNLFTAFDVSQQTHVLTPDAAADEGDELRNEVVAAQRKVEDELGATPISSYRAICGKDFFDGLRADLGIVQTLRYADPASLLAQEANVRRFNFAGVAWEEYRGSTGGTPFVADDEGYLYPEGAPIFSTIFGPADFMEAVNTIGLPLYAKIAFDEKYNRYVELHVQSNPLVLLTRPRAVIKLTLGT